MTDNPLNPPTFGADAVKDELFIRELIRNDGKEDAAVIAYRRAGYFNPSYAMADAAELNLRRPEIQTALAIQRKLFKPQIKGDASRDSVLADFDRVFEGALADRDWTAASNTKWKTAQLLGMVQETVNVNHRMEINQVPDSVLLQIINKKQPVIEAEFREVPVGIGHLKPPDGMDKKRSG